MASENNRPLEICFDQLLMNQCIWAQCLQSHLSTEYTQVLFLLALLFYTRSFYFVDND